MHKKAFVLICASLAMSSIASAGTIFGVTSSNGIAVFDSSTPGTITRSGAVTGLKAMESLIGIDYRASNGEVYLLGRGVSGSANDGNLTLYTLNKQTFSASVVGSGNFPPPLDGQRFGFDFNPSFMNGAFARVISDADDNRVVSGDNGDYLPPVEKTDVFYGAADVNNGVDPNIIGIAYDTNVAGATSTQQYGIDSNLGILTTVANNDGTLATIGSLGLGAPINTAVGFDISGENGVAYASFQIGMAGVAGLTSQLYTIDLTTGAATSVGQIASQDLIRDITVVPGQVPEPTSLMIAIGLVGLGASRRRRR